MSFSISGETIAVIEALKAAKQCGAVTVAVTGDGESTLAECADYVFVTPTIYAVTSSVREGICREEEA